LFGVRLAFDYELKPIPGFIFLGINSDSSQYILALSWDNIYAIFDGSPFIVMI